MNITIWRVVQEGDSRLSLTNNQNASRYDYSRSTRQAFLADPLTVAARAQNLQGFAQMLKPQMSVWCLTARDTSGSLLGMREFTLGPDATKLRADMLAEATFFASYLTLHGIPEAQDGPHLDAYAEHKPAVQFSAVPILPPT